MGLFRTRPKSNFRLAGATAGGRPATSTILHRSKSFGSVVLAALLGIGGVLQAHAQEQRPQIIPGERKPKAKKDTGPRAVAVLQMGANNKNSLVPIAILINGKFWDATAYKADPIPMALDYGVVYEVERAGNSLGLFTVGSALHRLNNANGTQPPWIGTGKYRPNGAEPETKPVKAEATPVGIDKSEGPPRLTRDPDKMNKPPDSAAPSPPSSAPASSPQDKSSSQEKSPSSSGDEPPRLSKPAAPSEPPANTAPGSTQSPSGSTAPVAEKPGDSKSGDSKPADSKSADSKPEDAKAAAAAKEESKIPTSDSGAGESNRPRLRRGKPAESFTDEDVPGYGKPGAKATADLSKAPAIATQGDVQVIPAISDAAGPDNHSFVFQWLPGEEADRRKQMVDLATNQLRAYLATKSKAEIPVKPVPHAVAARSSKAKDPILENVKMVSYDVWLSNQPVVILSAEGHLAPPAPGAARSEVESEMQYSVMVVAYPDIYNNLHKLYVGITDKYHLDVTPKLDLIDALDADGDGRGELLFRETTDQGTGWVIYRPTADKLWKMFDSLRPE